MMVYMEMVLLYIFIAVCACITYRNRRKANVGALTTKKGHVYSYVLGNYLRSPTASFNGLDITLPYSLANFYLDSHKDSKRQGPAALYDQSQQVRLEGNFNKYFQLFVPAQSATLVLSVLSPDVMQTLIASSQRYDVELAGEHLRIISTQKIDLAVDSAPLLAAATAIVAELDHRAISWRKGSAPAAQLSYRRGVTLKLAGRYLRRSRVLVSLVTILLTVLVLGLGLTFYYNRQDPAFNDPYSKGVFSGTMMYAAEVIAIAGIAIAMFAPLVWFFTKRPSKDIFPGHKIR